ncbi:HAMP domain-containing sensor histidine kinase [Niveibacterium sp. SC-1]|uniref:sensor histidine kinase n=1 Tax=Niveibacterium sp. SC-1 TaxID=3135646 RepID=UPI00311FAA12
MNLALMRGLDWQPAESRRVSLRYYSLYRLVAAAGLALVGRMFLGDGERSSVWLTIVGVYFLAAVALLYFQRSSRLQFQWVLSIHIGVDLLALAALMYASGGYRGGLAYMIMVVVAAGGLLGEGRLVFFYASVAAVLVLVIQMLVSLGVGEDPSGSIAAAGLVSMSFFAVATVARLLGHRALVNEAVAFQRGSALGQQIRLNERIISDFEDGVLVLDAEMNLLQLNPRAQAWLGRGAVPGRALAGLSAALAEAVREGRSEATLSVDGPQLRLRALSPDEGGVRLIYLEDMGRIERDAQQIKLAALGRLTGSIAHEIRNPLAAISHASELLAEEKRAEMQVRLTRIIQDNTRRIDRMVRDVLELGRRDRATPEYIQVDAFIATFIDDSANYEGLVAELVDYSGIAGAQIRFDRVHLYQVLWNLVGNARRHCSGKPGSIKIRTVMPEAGRLVILVSDDGPGVSPQVRSRLFEPFFTTDSKGTGLGLYIARELAEANDAQLDLGEAETGACFCLSAEGFA